MFEDEEICSKCGGGCCKSLPGACFPEDFGLPGSFNKLEKALESGKYSIDWWEGDPREGNPADELDYAYYIRPATINKVSELYDPSWGGQCCFLRPNGCELPPDQRPLNCQKLEPKENGECLLHDDADKQKAAIAWLPDDIYLSEIS